MSGPKHPARRARRIVAVASGASYIGLTASIAVATTLANNAEEVDAAVPATGSEAEQLALQLEGSATPASTTTAPAPALDGATTTVDFFAPTTIMTVAPEPGSDPTTPPAPPVSTAENTTVPTTAAPGGPATTIPATAAPTTAAPTTAAPTSAPATTAPPTTAATTIAPPTTAATTTAPPTTAATTTAPPTTAPPTTAPPTTAPPTTSGAS